MADYTKPTGGASRPTPPAEKKPIEKVVNGTVKTKKKNAVTKFADVFLAEDIDSVKKYLVSEVVVPTLKKAFFDFITKGASMFIYGDSRGAKTSDFRSADSISYRNYSDYSKGDRRPAIPMRAYGYSYEDLIYESHAEASEVLTRMDELMESYKVVSIADMKELSGIACVHTDYDYGWDDIRSANIVPLKDGWVIKMPKATPIKSMK